MNTETSNQTIMSAEEILKKHFDFTEGFTSYETECIVKAMEEYASQSTSVSTKANGEAEGVEVKCYGYDEYVEKIEQLMGEYEGRELSNAIASEIIEPLKTGTQSYWRALQEKHEDVKTLLKENDELKASTPKVEAEDVEALAADTLKKRHTGGCLPISGRKYYTDDELLPAMVEMYHKGAAQSTPKEAPQVAVECYTKEQMISCFHAGRNYQKGEMIEYNGGPDNEHPNFDEYIPLNKKL